MTDARLAPAGGRRIAIVERVEHPSARSVRIWLDVPDRVDHLPGQHYVIRLIAPDGYTASRSYSVASDPADPSLELFVERLADGEVSGFLADELMAGDELEIRGPIGGYFVWTGRYPAVAVGGGSGLVPIVSMLRHAARIGRPELLTVVAAARSMAELPYAAELETAGARLVLSREDRPGRAAGRLTAADLAGLNTPADISQPAAGESGRDQTDRPDRPGHSAGALPARGRSAAPAQYFVCGSAGFAESASRLLVDSGADPAAVRVERFGPSGS